MGVEWKIMYQNNFVASIISNGSILKELDGLFKLPFGSEYYIRLKNLNMTKALVDIKIDGESVLNGHELIVYPHSDYDLEGFLNKEGNKATHKFRFIEKTKEISNHRGNRIEDGIIEIKFKFENYIPIPPLIPLPYHQPYYWGYDTGYNGAVSGTNAIQYTKSIDPVNFLDQPLMASNYTEEACIGSADINEDGITVRGEKANQQFKEEYINRSNFGTEFVMCLRLVGQTRSECGKMRPIAVTAHSKEKQRCSSCGRSNLHYNRFCYNCGTALFN